MYYVSKTGYKNEYKVIYLLDLLVSKYALYSIHYYSFSITAPNYCFIYLFFSFNNLL